MKDGVVNPAGFERRIECDTRQVPHVGFIEAVMARHAGGAALCSEGEDIVI